MRCQPQGLVYMKSFDHQNNPVSQILLPLLCRGRNGGTERQSDLPQVTQPVREEGHDLDVGSPDFSLPRYGSSQTQSSLLPAVLGPPHKFHQRPHAQAWCGLRSWNCLPVDQLHL